MPRNNGTARRAQRKAEAALRLSAANEAEPKPREREIARGFTTGKRLTPYLAAREVRNDH
jgi:hypothetical protein